MVPLLDNYLLQVHRPTPCEQQKTWTASDASRYEIHKETNAKLIVTIDQKYLCRILTWHLSCRHEINFISTAALPVSTQRSSYREVRCVIEDMWTSFQLYSMQSFIPKLLSTMLDIEPHLILFLRMSRLRTRSGHVTPTLVSGMLPHWQRFPH